jgi:hypothetical protein
MMKIKNKSTVLSLFSLHYFKQRGIIIIIGAALLIVDFFGAIDVGSIVINDAANNRLTLQDYPATQFLGISAFSYEYGLVFTAILGVFVLSGGLVMDSKKKKNTNI